MNSQLINNLFLIIFSILENLTQNSNVNYKKIQKQQLFNDQQLCYSYNFSLDKILSVNFEIIVNNTTLNKIYVVSHSVIIKNLDNNSSLIDKIKYVYNELNNIDVEIRLENNHLNLCIKKLDNEDYIIFYTGIISFYIV